MRYNLVLGSHGQLREFTEELINELTKEADKISGPSPAKNSGRNARSCNPSKGGRCLIVCIGVCKMYLYNAVVATLSKQPMGWTSRPLHKTVRKQADVTVIRQSYVNKPFYADGTMVQQENNLKITSRLS